MNAGTYSIAPNKSVIPMTKDAAEILGMALALPEKDRAQMAELLTASLCPEISNLHPSWGPEVRRRAVEIQEGKTSPIPWSKVCEEISTQLGSVAD
jgi:putative addiction module component (TIGR02574 family)